MDAALLLLADSRLPAGGHAHSGGLETAAATGVIRDLGTLEDFLRGRLATAGLTVAGLAAAACSLALREAGSRQGGLWASLDAEADARTPSPAQRAASRAQGRALLRVARTMWPHPCLDDLDRDFNAPATAGPHHPIMLGAAAAAASGTPEQAARLAACGSVTGPATAAVRLLGLDPLQVHRVLARLAARIDMVALEAAASGGIGWASLPAVSAPALDLFAELHEQADLRLFES